jgi:DNA-binding LytR/AlgR family response regulator
MSSVNILVVEDEFLVAQDIAEHLSEMGYQVVGPVDNYEDAKMMVERAGIDLVLIDIRLRGEKDGIDLAHFIRGHADIPFIFLSFYEDKESVERAKAVHPSAFLLKPFHAKAVAIAIEMALANHALYKNSRHTISNVSEEDVLPIGKYLFLRKDTFFQRIALSDIRWIKADGNYTEFHTSGERFVQTVQLSKVEKRLPKNLFRRVHRSYMVNIDYVTGFLGNTLYLNNEKISVSDAYREDVFSLFNSI